MHVLVVNDDGPPSRRLSPYIRPFVDALQDAGHRVSVAVPAASRSWIGKAHIIEAPLKVTYVPPNSFRHDGTWEVFSPVIDSEMKEGGNHPTLLSQRDREWVVVNNGTPASCTQLGLFNLFTDRGLIDLVVSGPNHGRNASTIYNLSSGTVGGALEAATCGKRGIALSFDSKEEQRLDIIQAASRLSVQLIEHLCRDWNDAVELYNLNVPMRPDVEIRPIYYTHALPNYWSKGSLYAEVVIDKTADNKSSDGSAVPATRKCRFPWFSCSGQVVADDSPASTFNVIHRERYFEWSTELSDIKRSLESSEEGTDANTVLGGCTSVAPLRANFCHVPGLSGELRLDSKQP